MICPYCANSGRKGFKIQQCADGKVRNVTTRCHCPLGTETTPSGQLAHLKREIRLSRIALASSGIPDALLEKITEARRAVDTYCGGCV